MTPKDQSLPESVLIQPSRQQIHSRVSEVIVAQVQLPQTGVFGVQAQCQRSTTFICDQAAGQPAADKTPSV